MTKKHFIIIFVISAGVAFGVFSFAPASKTFYIKNSAKYLASATINQQAAVPASKNAGSLDTIIPSIRIPENLTESFAGILSREIIGKNDGPQAGEYITGPGINVPDPKKIAEEFINKGLGQANENILNIAPVNLKTSPDNSEEAISTYLTEAQKIINDGLEPKGSGLMDVLEKINKNNGAGSEELQSIAVSYEIVANEIEKKAVPSSFQNLMIEEVRLLRVTANVLRALANVETDPLGTMAAAGQFDSVIKSWLDLQGKFDAFIKKINQSG